MRQLTLIDSPPLVPTMPPEGLAMRCNRAGAPAMTATELQPLDLRCAVMSDDAEPLGYGLHDDIVAPILAETELPLSHWAEWFAPASRAERWHEGEHYFEVAEALQRLAAKAKPGEATSLTAAELSAQLMPLDPNAPEAAPLMASAAERVYALAWRINDVCALLNYGAKPGEIHHSIYRGICTGLDPEPLPPTDDDDCRPATADFSELDGIDAGMASPRFKLLSVADLRAVEPLRWRVRGILPADGLAALYGPPGCGKSFLAIDLLAAIAEGRPWFDYATTAAPCVYVGLEGEAGVAQRVQAYCAKRTAPDRLRVVLTPLDLRRPDDREELAAAIREAGMGEGVVAIDTLNRAAPGIDENDASSMDLLIDAAKDLRERIGGLVLLIHHAGKDITRGLRGHSSLLAALDCVLEVTREGDRRAWQLAKAKDAGDDESSPFRLDVVELGTDADGWPVSSCVVEPEAKPDAAVRKASPPGGGNQRIAWDALGDLLRASNTFGMGKATPMRPCVRLADALDAIAPRLPCEPKRQRERAQQAITGLIGRPGCLEHFDGWLWHP